MFNYNGTFVEEWTNQTRSQYNHKLNCFIKQCDKIQVNGINETGDDMLYCANHSGVQGATWIGYMDKEDVMFGQKLFMMIR